MITHGFFLRVGAFELEALTTGVAFAAGFAALGFPTAAFFAGGGFASGESESESERRAFGLRLVAVVLGLSLGVDDDGVAFEVDAWVIEERPVELLAGEDVGG
jgi:hypothetical protein